MNKSIYTIALICLVLIIGCKKDDVEPTPDPAQEQLINLMNGGVSWVVSDQGAVYKDNYDVTNQFAGFKLTIGEFNYSTENSTSNAWPTSGSWQFVDNDLNRIERNDGVLIMVVLSGNNLTLTFNVEEANTGGRYFDVPGEYSFHLVSE